MGNDTPLLVEEEHPLLAGRVGNFYPCDRLIMQPDDVHQLMGRFAVQEFTWHAGTLTQVRVDVFHPEKVVEARLEKLSDRTQSNRGQNISSMNAPDDCRCNTISVEIFYNKWFVK